MSNDPSNKAASLDEQLVAYLDGELDAESARRIEALLASDPEVRRRLQLLERTWDLLDELDAAPVGEPFTQTTLEMVAVAAREDVQRSRAETPRRRRRWLWTTGASLLAAVAAGYLAVILLAPDPNRQLLQDLPVLEGFDEYRQVESIEFLDLLRDRGLFSKPSGALPVGGATAGAEGPLSERRKFVERLDLGEKEQLLRIEERFTNLSPEEQQRLRRLYEVLQKAPDAERLRSIMHNYCEWLKTLALSSRAALVEMQPAEHVKWVQKQLRGEQRREGGRRLEGKDAQALIAWMNDCVTRHEKQFLETLSEPQRKDLAELGEPGRRLAFWMWVRGWPAESVKPAMLTEEDLARLRAKLTAETRKELEALSESKQWQRVSHWIRQRQMRHPARGTHGVPPTPDDDRLADFFEKGLSASDRDRLLGLPGEEMQQELMRLYLRHTRPQEGPGVRPRGPRPEGPDFGPQPGAQPVPKKKSPPGPK